MLAAKKRRSRSQFSSLSGDQRQVLHDQAVQKLQANDTQRAAQQKQKQLVEHDDRNRQAQQQAKMRAAVPKVGSAEVNKQAGNPRQGKSFRTRQVDGGEQHVYADGTRVFVRKHTRPMRKHTGPVDRSPEVQDAIKRVADQRAKMPTRGASAAPGGVMRRLMKQRTKRSRRSG